MTSATFCESIPTVQSTKYRRPLATPGLEWVCALRTPVARTAKSKESRQRWSHKTCSEVYSPPYTYMEKISVGGIVYFTVMRDQLSFFPYFCHSGIPTYPVTFFTCDIVVLSEDSM